MRDERDPIEELRDAWSALAPPEHAPEELDARTRAAVDWMRGAWATLEPGNVVVPRRIAARRALRRTTSLALVAALAAAILVVLQLATQRGEPAGGGEDVELASSSAADAPAVPNSASPSAPAALAREGGRLELRRGSVRLILLQPEPPAVGSGEAR